MLARASIPTLPHSLNRLPKCPPKISGHFADLFRSPTGQQGKTTRLHLTTICLRRSIDCTRHTSSGKAPPVKHMAVWPESIGVQQLRSYLGNTCHRRGKLNRISVMARPALYLFEEDRKGYSARPARTKSSHLATALNRREFDAIWNTPTVRAFASGKSGSAIAGISMRLIGCGNWLGIKQMILDRALDRHRGHFRDPQSNGIVASSLL
jgi:hypothetical protein